MASKRKAIIEAGRTRLQAIATGDGFNTDAGLNVLLNEIPELGKDDPDQVIAILIGVGIRKQIGNKVNVELPIEVQAITKADIDEPWIACENLLEDIKRAWELDDMTFYGLLSSEMEPGDESTAERQAGSTTVGLSIEYLVRYSERWGHPEQ